MEGGKDSVCFICDFCGMDLPYLQRILTNPDHGKDKTKYGFLEWFIENDTGEFMPNFVTRYLRFAVLGNKHALTLAKVLFFVLLGDQQGMQAIVRRQLQREKAHKKLYYFEHDFIPFVKSATKAMIQQPFQIDNVDMIFGVYLTAIQVSWLTQSRKLCVMQADYDEKLKAEIKDVTTNSKLNKQNARISGEHAPKAPARRNRKKINALLQDERKKVTVARP